MGSKKYDSSFCKFGRVDTLHKMDRATWNRAVKLIDHYEPKRKNVCKPQGTSVHSLSKPIGSVNTLTYLMVQIRQALLRHDWHTVNRLLIHLLDVSQMYRPQMNKVIFLLLLGSPQSNPKVIREFCNMILGVDTDAEIDTFIRTICKLPNEIPRGQVMLQHGKLLLKTPLGLIPADSYWKASRSD